MKYLGETNWMDVFAGWEKREANDPAWVECATKVKGWPDWKSWRAFTGQQLKAQDRKWELFEFDMPMEEIPGMLVGPFSGWQSRHGQTNRFDFKELLEVPEQLKQWSEHEKIRSMMDNFPLATEFIGLVREDLGRIVCLEGHHRATTVALAKKFGKMIDFGGAPRIALFKLPVEETGLLDEMLKRGTNFQSSN